MKKIKYLFIAALISFLGVSCSLEEESYTEINMDDYVKNTTEANNVLMGVYSDLCD